MSTTRGTYRQQPSSTVDTPEPGHQPAPTGAPRPPSTQTVDPQVEALISTLARIVRRQCAVPIGPASEDRR